MSGAVKPGFASFAMPTKGILVAFCDSELKFGPATHKILTPVIDLFRRAADADRFTGKAGSVLNLIAPAGLKINRVIVVGMGKASEQKPQDFVKTGGIVAGRIPAKT